MRCGICPLQRADEESFIVPPSKTPAGRCFVLVWKDTEEIRK